MAQAAADRVHLPEDDEILPQKSSTNAVTETTRLSKRLTQSFPVIPPPAQIHTDHEASVSPKYSSPAESARSSPRLAAQPASPNDPTNFLTTLAAQERRVLELREELHKAESDLAGLKKQWAIFEANRKKSGIRHVEQLQQLSASHLSKTESGGDIPTPLNVSTFEKLAAKPARKPQQRVFSGSRHTRTLSLLTPTSEYGSKAYPEPFKDQVSAVETDNENEKNKHTLSRSSTMPGSEANTGFGKTYKNLANRRSMPPPSADALVKTGKQMESDLRDGLWTFFEDIRQATVGEEGINGTDTRQPPTAVRQKSTPKSSPANGATRKKRSSTALATSARKTVDSDSKAPQGHNNNDDKSEQSFWTEFGVDTPRREGLPSRNPPPAHQEAEQQQQQQRQALLVDVDDDWDAWESPVSHQNASPRRTAADGPVDRSSNNDGTDALPWPALTKLTPSKLTRTVSDLMRDWESPYRGQSKSQPDAGEHVLASANL
jgi:hypothetical protein